jgi:AraC family transcriptional regulator of adaptative response/methylated-DNA-[protein]-cysteine methyltransferase
MASFGEAWKVGSGLIVMVLPPGSFRIPPYTQLIIKAGVRRPVLLVTSAVAFLKRLAEDPLSCWSSARLAELGINPVTARRHFERRFGISFLKYARSGRLAQAHAAIESGASVLMAQLDAGFESSSGFREAFVRKFQNPPGKARNCVLLSAGWIDTPLGVMVALTDERQVHLLEFVNRKQIGR